MQFLQKNVLHVGLIYVHNYGYVLVGREKELHERIGGYNQPHLPARRAKFHPVLRQHWQHNAKPNQVDEDRQEYDQQGRFSHGTRGGADVSPTTTARLRRKFSGPSWPTPPRLMPRPCAGRKATATHHANPRGLRKAPVPTQGLLSLRTSHQTQAKWPSARETAPAHFSRKTPTVSAPRMLSGWSAIWHENALPHSL